MYMFIILFRLDFHILPPHYLFFLELSKAYQNETCQAHEGPGNPQSHGLPLPGQESGPTADQSWPQPLMLSKC